MGDLKENFKKMKNSGLNRAKSDKNDEFYTMFADIEKEMEYHKDFLRGKTVLCNCDDPFRSNFFKYFVLNFHHLGIKKLITTCYAPSPENISSLDSATKSSKNSCDAPAPLSLMEALSATDSVDDNTTATLTHNNEAVAPLSGDVSDGFVLSREKALSLSYSERVNQSAGEYVRIPYHSEVTEVSDDMISGEVIDYEKLFAFPGNFVEPLDGDGDFRSEECYPYFKESDVVVTNPPFSLFRPYIVFMFEHNKDFLILGNQNTITSLETFQFVIDNRMRLGVTFPKTFIAPGVLGERKNYILGDDGTVLAKFGDICWYTTFPIDKSLRGIDLTASYQENPEKYPFYDRYKAINVDKIKDIPYDYEGLMGVPITVLQKHDPEQFIILGRERYVAPPEALTTGALTIGGKVKYTRLIVKLKNPR